MISIGYTCQRLSFLMSLMFLSVYKSHDAVPFLDFQKNEENLKRLGTLSIPLNFTLLDSSLQDAYFDV
jgi:hypothetical protein